MSGFALDERLAADTVLVADGPLSQLRLMDDARFPWLVLVPRVPGAVEWFDLGVADQALLWNEVRRAAKLLRAAPSCEKINLGALGNIVRQLHVHVVARHPGDAAWPGPVWGSGAARRHAPEALAAALAMYREAWAARG
jgi:diadenosine tetraphosphate (Ap4A) HIT family hydrolase